MKIQIFEKLVEQKKYIFGVKIEIFFSVAKKNPGKMQMFHEF